MRYLFTLLIIAFMFTGCSAQDQQVAKDTAAGTAKDIAKGTKEGIEKVAHDVGYAAPDIKEDIADAFWDTVDAIDILIDGESVNDIPQPAEVRGMQMVQGFGRGVYLSAQKVKEQGIQEYEKAFDTLSSVLQEEIQKSKADAAGVETPVPEPQIVPRAEEIHSAWVTFAEFADTPDKARVLFNSIKKAVDNIPDIKIASGIQGPVEKSKIGEKANEFLSQLRIGQVSSPVKFKKGILFVQLIDDTGETVEAGFIYIPLVEVNKMKEPAAKAE